MPATITQQLEQTMPLAFDVAQAFQALTKSSTSPTALLESACIDTRICQKSVMMLSAALKIRCLGETVEVGALNENGRQYLAWLNKGFPQANLSGHQLDIHISHQAMQQEPDEHQKLNSPNVFDVLRKILAGLRVGGPEDQTTQLIGTFAFDCFDLFEPVEDAVNSNSEFPYFEFFLADRLAIVDHHGKKLQFVSKVFPGSSQESLTSVYLEQLKSIQRAAAQLPQGTQNTGTTPSHPIRPIETDAVQTNLDDRQYCDLAQSLKEHIAHGDIFQAVLARHFRLPCRSAFGSYQVLKQLNPSPYMFYVATPDYVLFGSSPESAVKFEESERRVTLYPIAGTRKRGLDDDGNILPELDIRLEMELRRDTKENAEHAMLVDLARNDIAKVSKSGSRSVDRLMEIDRYSQVMHLVSKVSGILRDDLDALSAYQACMNMGTLSGTPKVRATQLIRQYEPLRRGVYGGAVGYLNAVGDMDTAIVIRSAFVKDGIADVAAGAGIVHDSAPQQEAQETRDKARAVCQAILRSNQQILCPADGPIPSDSHMEAC